jgi:hypothetical protein
MAQRKERSMINIYIQATGIYPGSHQDGGGLTTIATKPLSCPKIERGQEQLTPEQEAYAHQFAQERIDAMLSTAAIDEAQAEEHLRNAYRVAGLEPPQVRWFDSPSTFVMAHLEDSLESFVRDFLWASLANSLWASVGDSVLVSVWHSVWKLVRDSVWASMPDEVRDFIRDSAGGSARAYHDACWHAFYRFFHEVFETNDLIHLALLNEMVSGFRFGQKEAWLVRKPLRLERDERGRLHSTEGMCLQYPNGWGFYAWHGVRVPEQIILHPERFAKEDWRSERNLEIRRAIQERLGPDRFVALMGAVCLDQSNRGTLVEVDLGIDPAKVAHYVQVQDSSTERQYYLRVPPEIWSADEAVAWTFGLDGQDYRPTQET